MLAKASQLGLGLRAGRTRRDRDRPRGKVESHSAEARWGSLATTFKLRNFRIPCSAERKPARAPPGPPRLAPPAR
eukprot:10226178-Alexandrium_andersonii.AAC.1